MKYYTITQFAKIINVIPNTLRVWDKERKLVPIKLASGHRRYTDEHLMQLRNDISKKEKRQTVIYIRESTKKQEESLKLQEQKIKDFCLVKGWTIDKVYSDIGSALNYNRENLQELIQDICQNKIERIVIFYKDRLVRFGFEFFEQLCKIFNIELVIIDNTETNKSKEKEFADDLISIIHYFSMKLYGSRSYKKKVESAEKCINSIKDEIK